MFFKKPTIKHKKELKIMNNDDENDGCTLAGIFEIGKIGKPKEDIG
jgi:hypothetical protein